jgi:hypothetical protein
MDRYLHAYRSHIRRLRGSGATVGKEMGCSASYGLERLRRLVVATIKLSVRLLTLKLMLTGWLAGSVVKTADE